jgi:Domain of unknown function (DUF4402)
MPLFPRHIALFGVLMLNLAHPAQAQNSSCQLCGEAQKEARRADDERAPIRIDVETMLDFSRVTQTHPEAGEITVDPISGDRQISGALTDLGGMALRGSARITGEPHQPVLITLPNRVLLTSSHGSTAEVVDIKSDLGTTPTLDGNGQLRFSFGGRLRVQGRVSGVFRGSIPITADYP